MTVPDKQATNLLDGIVAHKRREVAERKAARPVDELTGAALPPTVDFVAALRASRITAIAEIKRRSPSRGALRSELDVADIARRYADHGAAALSVLTDRAFFGGQHEDLEVAKRTTGLPVLLKDFIVDAYQIHEARLTGADAILLIVRILTDAELREFVQVARQRGLGTLVETHNEAELTRAVDCGAELIGVNNRDLDTFAIDLNTCLRLKERIPAACIAVAESGIHTRDDVERVEAAGYDAMLVGEALMSAADPGRKLAELLGRSP